MDKTYYKKQLNSTLEFTKLYKVTERTQTHTVSIMRLESH